MNNKKVLLGVSGGVDSSVALILLKEKGYKVAGATLNLFQTCSLENNEIDAKNICEKFNCSHYIYNMQDEFKDKVINNFVEVYGQAKTPNPCIECNKYLKFRAMYEKAKELGFDYIATGHYAKVEYSEKYNKWVLKKSKSGKKDQSYVLWSIDKEILPYIIFPLGDFDSKDQIREIARKNNLEVASKPDSEDICFIPDGDYKKFLEEKANIKFKSGNIVDKNNVVLGKHDGLHRYTIGQRRGLGISSKHPLFVLGFNKDTNEVIVGKEEELYTKEIVVTDVNLLLIDKLENPMEVNVKTRYSSKEAKATIYPEGDNIKVIFENPQRAITPGQSAVFYVDDIVLGGGKIV